MIVLLYLQGFTAGYTIKETNIFLSSDKKNVWAKPPDPNSSHIMYIGLNTWCRRPESTFKVLNYTVKISDGCIFGHYFCPKLKSSEIFCK